MRNPCRVAILPWGDVIEDYIDPAGITLEEFATQMSGGWLFGYIVALRKANIESIVVCFSRQVKEIKRWNNQSAGVEVFALPSPKSLRFARSIAGFLFHFNLDRTARLVSNLASHLATPEDVLRNLLQKEHCDVILVQEYEDPRFDKVTRLGRRLGLPVFASFQGGQWQRSPLERWFRDRSMRLCNGLIVGSARAAELVTQRYHLPDNKIARIYNPLDTELWQPQDQAAARSALGLSVNGTIVVWHGRVDIDHKGLDILCETWGRIVKSATTSVPLLLLIGDGKDRDSLARLLRRLPGESWRWIDQFVLDRSLMRTYLCAGDLSVLSSRREGFPVAPLEAMSCGLPIVATEVFGIHEIVSDGIRIAGLVVPTDDVEALTEAIKKMVFNATYRQSLAKHARPLATDRFSYASIGKQLSNFIRLQS